MNDTVTPLEPEDRVRLEEALQRQHDGEEHDRGLIVERLAWRMPPFYVSI